MQAPAIRVRVWKGIVVVGAAAGALFAGGAAAGPQTANACGIGGAPSLPVGRLVTTPSAAGCDIWRIRLQAGDRVTLRVAAGDARALAGFMIPGMRDSDIADHPEIADDLRGTDCQLEIDPHQAGQSSCSVAGTHDYFVRVQQYDPGSAQVEVLVRHSATRPTVGTCNIFAKPPLLRLKVWEYGDSYQACPNEAMGEYLGTDKSPYPFVERWRVPVRRPRLKLRLSGALTSGVGSDSALVIQVLKPNTDPTDYPDPSVVFIPGHREVCRIEIQNRPTSTRCVFSTAGNYIVVLATGGHTVRFTFSR
jgi:hypothetical protein